MSVQSTHPVVTPLPPFAALDYQGTVQRLLISLGLLIAAIGLLWPWHSKLPFGRLPGDFAIDRRP